MEATGVYFEPLAEYLVEVAQTRPWTISVVNPARISAYGKSKLQRGKIDQADAALIAQFCQEQHPDPWQPTPVELKQLQGFTRHLEALKQDRQIQFNRLESIRDVQIAASIEAIISALDEQIAQTNTLIEERVNAHPTLERSQRLLCSIPGIGFIADGPSADRRATLGRSAPVFMGDQRPKSGCLRRIDAQTL